MSGAIDLEVLIVSYNSADVLVACLASVQRTIPGTPIAIREHGSDASARDHLASIAESHPAPVRIEDDPTNPGFATGCNALARSSSAMFLLFLNPDAELVDWPWSDTDRPPTDTIVGPRMIESGHPGDHSGVHYRVRDEVARSWLRWRGSRPDGAGFVSGAALLIDRRSFNELHGFDERYFLFYEDIELGLRANGLGITTRLDQRWTVRHTGAHSTRLYFGRSLEWSYESAVLFHGERGESVIAYRVYVVVDATLRCVAQVARRNTRGAKAYLVLARRAATDLVRTSPSP